MDFYRDVPRDFESNIAYRLKLRERCVADAGFRRAMWTACKEDVLFFFSAFCWLYEPRPRRDSTGRLLPKMIPFIPWEHQVPAIKEMRANLGFRDITVFKSRGEGFSWIAVLLALHDWLFDEMSKVGLVSNTEKKADDPGNMDSLMAKIDWEIEKLPSWMSGDRDVHWKRNLSEHSLVNLRNGSQINAFAATADAGRAGRYKWFLADELAFWAESVGRDFMEAIRESTDSRLAISTPNGASGVFYDTVHKPSNILKIRIHWTENSYKNRGLYRLSGNTTSAVDPKNNPLCRDYYQPSQEVIERWARLRAKGFKLEDSLRSPWYDEQCDRTDATPQSIAQELDLDFGGSMFRVFTHEFFTKTKRTVCPPHMAGNFSYHPETLEPEFVKSGDGAFKLWTPLDSDGNPPRGRYAAGCDISSGLGGSHTSNSSIQIVDTARMVQVASFAVNTIEPSEFGEYAVAVVKWFHNAYLGWEANFGGGFTKRVIDLGYEPVYRRTIHWKKSKRKGKEIGWWTDERSKELMLSDFLRLVKTGEFEIRCEELERECGEYVRSGPQSQIRHVLSDSTADESSRGKAHGDRVIAMAIALQLCKDRPADNLSQPVDSAPPPVDTLAWRVARWNEDDYVDEWDDRPLSEFATPGMAGVYG